MSRALPTMIPAPAALHEVFTASVICGPPVDLGEHSVLGSARRVLYPIEGGEVAGEINGTVLPGGGDHGVAIGEDFYADTRYTIRTDDGDVLYVQTEGNACIVSQHEGLADFYRRRGISVTPGHSLFRMHIRIETGAASRYSFLTKLTLVGAIERVGQRVEYKAYAVL